MRFRIRRRGWNRPVDFGNIKPTKYPRGAGFVAQRREQVIGKYRAKRCEGFPYEQF
jgi:hypothetical protein